MNSLNQIAKAEVCEPGFRAKDCELINLEYFLGSGGRGAAAPRAPRHFPKNIRFYLIYAPNRRSRVAVGNFKRNMKLFARSFVHL
jgi:hypothetical protein